MPFVYGMSWLGLVARSNHAMLAGLGELRNSSSVARQRYVGDGKAVELGVIRGRAMGAVAGQTNTVSTPRQNQAHRSMQPVCTLI